MLKFDLLRSHYFWDPAVVETAVQQIKSSTHDRVDDSRVDEILDMAHRIFNIGRMLDDWMWDEVTGLDGWQMLAAERKRHSVVK